MTEHPESTGGMKVGSPGCGAPPSNLVEGDNTFMLGDLERRYVLRLRRRVRPGPKRAVHRHDERVLDGLFGGRLVLRCARVPARLNIRAIAVGGSVIYFEEEDCTETPAAWITIGDGELTAGREAFRDFFRDRAGCQASSTAGMPDGCIDYDGCGADTPVTFCSHPAGHVWPSIGTDATKTFL